MIMIRPVNRLALLILACFLYLSSYAQDQQRIDSIRNVLNTAKEDTNKVFSWINLNIAVRGKDSKEASLYLDSALSLSEKLNYKPGMRIAYYFFGIMFSNFHNPRNYPEAIKNYEHSLRIAEEMGDDRQAAICYESIGLAYFNTRNYEKALENHLAQLHLREKLGQKKLVAYSKCLIARNYLMLNNYKEAIKIFSSALALYEEVNDKQSMASVYFDIGEMQKEQGNYAEALKNLMSGLKIHEEAKNKIGIFNLSLMIGEVYTILGNYPEAEKNQLVALKIAEESGSNARIAVIRSTIGNTYREQGDYSSALKNYFVALNFYDTVNKKGSKYEYAGVSLDIGRVYKKQAEAIAKEQGNVDSLKKKLAESVKALLEAKVILENFKSKDGMAESYTELGIVISRQGSCMAGTSAKVKYNEAIVYLKNALLLASEMGTKKVVRDAYAGLAETYQRLNDYKNAFEYTTRYVVMKDSLLSKDSLNKIEQLRIDFEKASSEAAEKARQEKIQSEMQFAFTKREDSLKYQQRLTEEQLKQQTLLAKQHEQALLLNQASLDLSNTQIKLNKLAYLKTEAELQAEQSERKEKEKQLTIVSQEKALQLNQLSLQQIQLDLKESQIQAERKQRLFYIGGIILLSLLFVFIYRNNKNRQRTEKLVASERLKSEKANAAHKMAELELQSLRAQLNPHFMFNSLNAIQELILKEDNDNSHLYLSRFAELLRMLLDNADQAFVSLRKEISLLELYLSLENLRIPDLKYSIEVDPSIDANKMTIPNMMLQPYIENAIWHGLSPKKGKRNLNIRIVRKEDMIVCEVEDNGVGRKMAAELKSLYRKEHRSKGMELLSKRFSLLSKEYGSDIQTTIEDLHDNGTALGTRVAITVPYSLTERSNGVTHDKSSNN